MDDQRINAFIQNTYLPVLHKIAVIPRLVEDFEPTVITTRPHHDEVIEYLLQELDSALTGLRGPALVIRDRTWTRTLAIPHRNQPLPTAGAFDEHRLAGLFAMSVSFVEMEGQLFAEPAAAFRMQFNRAVHRFTDYFPVYQQAVQGVAPQRPVIDEVKSHHIFNHFMNCFDFFRLYALRDEPFPGYRG